MNKKPKSRYFKHYDVDIFLEKINEAKYCQVVGGLKPHIAYLNSRIVIDRKINVNGKLIDEWKVITKAEFSNAKMKIE